MAYNGFEENDFAKAERRRIKRDPWRLVYFSHPSKGLDTAIDILQRLRVVDRRFHLYVYGGSRLWGQEPEALPTVEGLHDGGLIGQAQLARKLFSCTYSLNLQSRLEPFGMVITESMRAGCIVIASPVGAYRELIRDGEDGFLVRGDHNCDDTRQQAAELILRLSRNLDSISYVQKIARNVIWDTDTMVRVWEAHWRWWFDRQATDSKAMDRCIVCGGIQLWMADGYHCLHCGRYSRRFSAFDSEL